MMKRIRVGCLQISMILSVIILSCGIDLAVADHFRKLTGRQINEKIAGMDISDNVHWRDHYDREGKITSDSMGRRKTGKWWVNKNDLCIERGKDDGGCYEVWMAGRKIEFRRPGLDAPFLEGTLQNPIKRD